VRSSPGWLLTRRAIADGTLGGWLGSLAGVIDEGKQYGVHCRCPITRPDDWTPPVLDEHVDIPGEQILLDETRGDGAEDQEFRAWLLQQINPPMHAERLMSYFDRVEVSAGHALYKQGDLADTVDFVARGSLLIELVGDNGERQRLRRIATHSIVGEMGFFRRLTRSAAVTAEEAAVVYSLPRDNFERMRRESPELAEAFCQFVIQVLADRVDFANRAISALAR